MAVPGILRVVGFPGTVNQHWRQHRKAWVEKHPVLDWKQNVVDVTVYAARTVVRFPAAGGDQQHGAFAGQIPLTVAIAPVMIAVLAHAVGKTVGIYPVKPAFHDGRHREPPQRKLENHGIGPA
ncbi:hypothetical protein D3C80_1380740 [compost metagenome]